MERSSLAAQHAAPAVGLEDWVSAITENELPLFAQGLGEVSSVASLPQSSAADLAGAITLDISLSVRLLKVANSPMLNPQDRDIDSVRTAVVLMGFDAVRDLAFSLSLVSGLQRDGGTDRLVCALARAFHTASHAQGLARAAGDRYPEEAFVAGLLLNLGEMVFWSRRRPETARVEALLARGMAADAAERQVLGFPLRQLTRRLADEWRMSGLLRATLATAIPGSPRCRGILLAEDVADTVERHGWDTPESRVVEERAAELLGTTTTDAGALLRRGTSTAGRMARRFGVEAIEKVLAVPPEPDSPPGQDDPPFTGTTPDPDLLRQADQDVRALLQGKPDLDRLVRAALDGVHRGLGLDRAFFAMLSPDRAWLQARYAVGRDEQELLRYCRINVGADTRSLFRILLESGKAAWVDQQRRSQLGELITPDIDAWARGEAFYVMPIFARERAVGLLYADRAESARALDEASFSGFRRFGDHIAQGLVKR